MKTTEDRVRIPLSEIVPDENQPRKMFEATKLRTLKDSVKKFGVMSPITVEKIDNKYLIVDGERRFRVATDLKLKEIPATVIAPQNAVDRLVQQFHIQEQHEEWSPTEKALTVWNLSNELGMSLYKIGELLGIDSHTARRYAAFAELVDKKAYQKNQISIAWAEPLQRLKHAVKRIKTEELEEEFSRSDERKFENAIIDRIKEGQFTKPTHLTRIKDAFVKDPKSIDEFMNTKVTVDRLFIKTKAKEAYYLRNVINNASYLRHHVREFLKTGNVKLTGEDMETLKRAKKSIEEVLNLAE